jgi:hypothetical protein
MCNKIPYQSQQEAREAAKGMAKRRNQSMRHYWCTICECWHLGTEGKKKKKRYIRNNKVNKYPMKITLETVPPAVFKARMRKRKNKKRGKKE